MSPLPDNALPTPTSPVVMPIAASLGVQIPTPRPITSGQSISTTQLITDVSDFLSGTQSTLNEVVSYTDYFSATMYEIILNDDVLDENDAPEWYATPLPRPVANVGWRFEQMSQDTRKRYSVASWGVWVAETAALPVQMVKGLRWITEIFSPLGLFIGWLLIMLPIVAVFRAMKWLKNAFIGIFNFVFEVIKFLISLIPGIG